MERAAGASSSVADSAAAADIRVLFEGCATATGSEREPEQRYCAAERGQLHPPYLRPQRSFIPLE